MRCYCCNVILTPQEATRRFVKSGEFVDMCNTCLATISDDADTKDSDNLEDVEDE